MYYSRILIFGAVIGLGGAGFYLGSTGASSTAATEKHASHSPDRVEPPDYEAYRDLRIPPLSPEKALETFELEEGFRIEVVAHEPMVLNPVAMDIDPDGRLWVVEMTSYMPVHDRGDWETAMREQVPQGRVVVLEDTTGDGKMDTSRTFSDEIILPRAIKVLDDGILVAEPPNVWFIQDTNGDGKGDTREIVYDSYGDPTSDNVEHMPNGLMWGIDNWLHSSHSRVESLRRVDGEWRTRSFRNLGQWGMTQDDWGRLYSSHNTQALQAHIVPYGYSERHPRFSVRHGKNRNIAPGEVWPAHPTGVNRGYRDRVLRDDGTLRTITATCGPVIYRGDQFGDDYRGNTFVPEPAGNLIKRYLVESDPADIDIRARFAYENREFLTSTDERFRPVNMYNAPDGSLYVVDMYRGIFQHARFLTDYLRDYAVEHDLHQPRTRFGRIYRIVREDSNGDYETPKLSEKEPRELVDYLRHENGLLRDLAQQLLVQRSPVDAVSALRTQAVDPEVEAYTRLHSLWTLEGFDRSVFDRDSLAGLAREALDDSHPRVRAAAIRILEPSIAENSGDLLTRLEEMARDEASQAVQLQLLASLGESVEDQALRSMARILDRNVDRQEFREIALTGVYRKEARMAAILRRSSAWSENPNAARRSVLESLAEAEEALVEESFAHLTEEERIFYDRGGRQYRTCMACHGVEGEGVEGVATPLAGSEWVEGEPGALVRIVLQGFDSGEATVPGVMPPHGFMSDDDVAAVLTYIRQSWGNRASPVMPDEVEQIREEPREDTAIWTAEQLRELDL